MTKTGLLESSGRTHRPALLAVLLAAACLPPATAHGAPLPADDHIHRVLEDHNDDCGGDGITANCGGTNDLLALDVIERWDGSYQSDVLVLRLIIGPGEAGDLEQEIRFLAGDAQKTFTLASSDGQSFTGDFDRIEGPTSIGDGDRVQVDGVLKVSTLGVEPGVRLTDFAIDATRNGKLGDYMPGGYYTAVGVPVEDPPQGSEPTDYGPVPHDLVGPARYAALVAPDQLHAGANEIKITNLLRRTPQTVTLDIDNLLAVEASGARASFEDGSTTKQITVAKASVATAQVLVEGHGSGAVSLMLTTDLGGRVVKELPLEAGTAGTPVIPPPAPSDDKSDSPSAGLLVLLVATATAFAMTRRRT